MKELINEHIDNSPAMNEAFENLMSFIKTNRFTSKEVNRSDKVLKSLTKQIWSRFYMYQKRQQRVANNRNMSVLPMDKKFIDGFMSVIKTEQDIRKNVYEQVGREINLLDKLYKGTRSAKTTPEQFKERLKENKTKIMTVVSHIINAIALETTLHYLDINMDLDMDSIEGKNKKKVLKNMRDGSKKFTDELVDGVGRAVSDRANKR